MATQPIDMHAINAWPEPEPEPNGTMSHSEIVSILREQERAAASFRDTTLSGEQASAIDFYEAEPFGDEEEGRSQVVVPDVAEVCDYMQISILRTVASADRVVEFEPGDTDELPQLPDAPVAPPQQPAQPQQDPNALPPPPDPAMQAYQQQKAQYDAATAQVRQWEEQRDKAADDATEAVNHIFMRRQNGYRILVDWLQSGLIEKIGIIKTACVTERRKMFSPPLQIDGNHLALLHMQGEDVSQATPNPDGTFTIPQPPQYQEVKRYVDYPIPSEEFLFAPLTRDEDDCPYLAHKSRKTLSDLIEMGFDRETVENLPTDDGNEILNDQRAYSRWRDEDTEAYQRAPSMRRVVLMEEYAFLDRDGDGIAERWQIFRVGDVILGETEVDDQPFVVWTPFPRAHRMVGNSLAEKTMDIQRVNSVLLRQALDGTYLTNNPRTWLPDDAVTENTIDDLLTVRPGGIIRGRGQMPPQPFSQPFDIEKSLGMLEYMTGMRESRTGITRLNQGLDEDTINKTASGQAALQATGQQMEEFVARNFAEAMSRLFAKKLKLMASNGEPIAIKVNGNYRRIDPSTWDTDMNVVVHVGLGSGRKEQRLIYRTQVAQQQAEALSQGLPIVNAKRLYKNAVGYVRDANLGNPDDYWIDPDSDEGQQAAQASQGQQQPDPALIKAQADAAAQQQAGALKAQESQQQINLSQQESAAKLDIMHNEGQQKFALAAEKHQQESGLAASKAQFEAGLAQQTADRNFEIAIMQERNRHELAQQAAQHAHEQKLEAIKAKPVPQDRPGGDLSK